MSNVHHGYTCEKVEHLEGVGYLHEADDNRPYWIDNVAYCGRCHHWLSAEDYDPEPHPVATAVPAPDVCTCLRTGDEIRLCPWHQQTFNTILTEGHQLRQSKAVDALSLMAVSLNAVLGTGVEDVPRLLASAACRHLENLIHHYTRHRVSMTVSERAKLRKQMNDTATDLTAALSEGHARALEIVASLSSGETVQ